MVIELGYVLPLLNCNLLSVKEMMEEALSVRFITFSNGERYPLLLNHEKKPHWYATLYATTSIPQAKMLSLEKCGHFPYIEKPDEIFFQINRFLTDVEK